MYDLTVVKNKIGKEGPECFIRLVRSDKLPREIREDLKNINILLKNGEPNYHAISRLCN